MVGPRVDVQLRDLVVLGHPVVGEEAGVRGVARSGIGGMGGGSVGVVAWAGPWNSKIC